MQPLLVAFHRMAIKHFDFITWLGIGVVKTIIFDDYLLIFCVSYILLKTRYRHITMTLPVKPIMTYKANFNNNSYLITHLPMAFIDAYKGMLTSTERVDTIPTSRIP